MSRIGQKSILVPDNIVVSLEGKTVVIKGSKGELTIVLPREIDIEKSEKTLILKTKKSTKKAKSLHGLYRQLVYNAVVGVEKPWEKKLEIVGTGFNVKSQGEDLVFKLGYSHNIVFKKKENIVFKVDGSRKIVISGIDKQLVGEIAYQIRILKKPDVYKGKGIRYQGEQLRIKPGKKAKTAGDTGES